MKDKLRTIWEWGYNAWEMERSRCHNRIWSNKFLKTWNLNILQDLTTVHSVMPRLRASLLQAQLFCNVTLMANHIKRMVVSLHHWKAQLSWKVYTSGLGLRGSQCSMILCRSKDISLTSHQMYWALLTWHKGQGHHHHTRSNLLYQSVCRRQFLWIIQPRDSFIWCRDCKVSNWLHCQVHGLPHHLGKQASNWNSSLYDRSRIHCSVALKHCKLTRFTSLFPGYVSWVGYSSVNWLSSSMCVHMHFSN
jgi:hypothetical protein